MLFASLGKRYERILFFTAPISLAAIVVLVVALASTKQKERVDAQCFNTAAQAFRQIENELREEWELARPVVKDGYWGAAYKLEIELGWIEADQTPECYMTVNALIDEQYRQPPEAIVRFFEEEALALSKAPLAMYGVQLPPNTTVNLLGTKIEVELVTFARVLQVVLLPVLLMWLGSLYTTRYRETLLIGRASSLAEVFPHIINLYPTGEMLSPRKRSLLAPLVVPILCAIFALIRILLLAVFVAPPVAAYLGSLYLLGNEEYAPLFVAAGISVSLFCFTTLFAEVLPQHAAKIFPSPYSNG